ncbi:MAG: hypothetical protein RML56_07215 [Burkholderiales bacterium]|nr:hypothetical protein [Burkholderiales bacterium]
MRASILGALRRSDPKTLEEAFVRSSGGLALHRKAKRRDHLAQTKQLRRK